MDFYDSHEIGIGKEEESKGRDFVRKLKARPLHQVSADQESGVQPPLLPDVTGLVGWPPTVWM